MLWQQDSARYLTTEASRAFSSPDLCERAGVEPFLRSDFPYKFSLADRRFAEWGIGHHDLTQLAPWLCAQRTNS